MSAPTGATACDGTAAQAGRATDVYWPTAARLGSRRRRTGAAGLVRAGHPDDAQLEPAMTPVHR